MPFPLLVLLALALTPIGVGSDHVIKGANQQTLAAGDGESRGGSERVTTWRKRYANLVAARHDLCSPMPFHSAKNAKNAKSAMRFVPKVPKLAMALLALLAVAPPL